MSGDPARDVIDVLTKRSELVSELRDGECCLRDLRDDLDVSRSTIYKAVRELESAGIASRDGEGVALTAFGRLAYDHYAGFAGDIDRMSRLRPHLPDAEASPAFSPVVFRDAEIVLSERHDPDRPLDTFEDRVRQVDRFRGFSPVARSRYTELFRECVAEGEMEATIITEESTIEVLLSEHREDVGQVIGADGLEVRQTEGSLPFGLACLGDPIECIIAAVYDDRLQLVAIVINESTSAIEWGKDAYESVRERTALLEPGTPEMTDI